MKSDKELLPFGSYLQTIRLEKKISLEKIASQTRIGIGNLLLIEQEDIERLPAAVFVKGFLRSYATAIGADGDEAVRRYESRLDVLHKIAESDAAKDKHAAGMWWKFSLSLALLFTIILGSIFGIAFFRDHPGSDLSLEKKAAVAKDPTVDTPDQQGTAAETAPSKVVSQKFTLQVTALEDTWLKVIIDEKASTEYSLSSGDRIELEATSGYNLLIGNAGGLKIKLNDKPISIAGKSGQVVTLHLP